MKILLVSLAITAIGFLYAPGFLAYDHPIENADSVIVMVGPGREYRFQYAEQLVKQGRANTLLIPAFRKAAFLEGSDLGERKSVDVAPITDKPITVLGRKLYVLENTHLELLVGKEMMDKLGYRSTIIVSSPYHMRRLKLIADKVFEDGDYRIGFEATPFEEYGVLNCLRSWSGFWNVASEYVKIGWFLVYDRLMPNLSHSATSRHFEIAFLL